jgi:hypothetical protein
MTILYLIYSSYYKICRFSLYMSKPPKPIFHNIYTIGATPTIPTMLPFRILSHLISPHIQRNIPISTHLLYSRVGSTANILFHKTSLFWQLSGFFSFQLKRHVGIIKNTSFLHFNHPTWIQWITSDFISPLFCTMNPRFFLLKEWTQDI